MLMKYLRELKNFGTNGYEFLWKFFDIYVTIYDGTIYLCEKLIRGTKC